MFPTPTFQKIVFLLTLYEGGANSGNGGASSSNGDANSGSDNELRRLSAKRREKIEKKFMKNKIELKI